MGSQGYSETSMAEIDRSDTPELTRANRPELEGALGAGCGGGVGNTWKACSDPAGSCSWKAAGCGSCTALCMCRDDSWAHSILWL